MLKGDVKKVVVFGRGVGALPQLSVKKLPLCFHTMQKPLLAVLPMVELVEVAEGVLEP